MNEDLIQAHKCFLNEPISGTTLYKIIKHENFLDMLDKGYLYFHRVDQYADDKRDSDQTDKDKVLSRESKFEKKPSFTLEDYYAQARQRSYACCFTTEETDHIWQHYAGNDNKACCLVLDCDALIRFLNRTYSQSYMYGVSFKCKPFLFLNYGLVAYGDLLNDELAKPEAPNPIEYLYFKGEAYSKEKEFRITLSAFGVGNFRLPDKTLLEFPASLRLDFNFREALNHGVIKQLKISQDYPPSCFQELKSKLMKYGDIKIIKSPKMIVRLIVNFLIDKIWWRC